MTDADKRTKGRNWLPGGSQPIGGTSHYSDEILADGPVAYYKLNETSGTVAADSSGNGRHGTYGTAVALNQLGAIRNGDGAAFFDGSSNSWFESSSNAALALPNSGGTLELWLFWRSTSILWLRDHSGANGKPGFLVVVNTSGGTSLGQIAYRTGSLAGGGDILTGLIVDPYVGAWHHHVVAWNASESFYYIDGIQKFHSTDDPGTDAGAAVPWHIGKNGSLANYEPGGADEFALYASQLSEERIQAHYVAGISG